MFTDEQINDLKSLLRSLTGDTKLYIGTDSARFRKEGRWFAKYASVCVVHRDGRHGCQVFRHKSVEPDYDMKKNKPSLRLMNEVMKSCELYTQLAPIIDDYEVEIHLDVNPDIKYGSSCVAVQAAGYVLGVTGIKPKLKPDAFAASFSADHYANKPLVKYGSSYK